MSKSTQNKLNILRDILNNLLKKASSAQKETANRLLRELINELNYKENIIKNLEEKLNGNPKEYRNELEKAGDILFAMGFTTADFDQIQKGSVDLVIKDLKILKRQLTNNDLMKINNMYNIYKAEFNREPETLTDLNKIFEDVQT